MVTVDEFVKKIQETSDVIDKAISTLDGLSKQFKDFTQKVADETLKAEAAFAVLEAARARLAVAIEANKVS